MTRPVREPMGVLPLAAVAGLLLAPLETQARQITVFDELDFPTVEVARQSVQRALERRPSGETEFWRITGVAAGRVTPLRTWRSKSGHWCREYEERIELADGRTQATRAIRCRTADGRWLTTED